MVIGASIDAITAFLITPIFDLIMQDQGVSSQYTSITRKIFEILDTFGLPKTTAFALALFLAVYLFRSLISVFAGYFESIVRGRLQRDLTINVFDAVVNANWKFYLNRNQGEFINSIVNETNNLSYAYFAFSSCVVACFQADLGKFRKSLLNYPIQHPYEHS